MNNPPVKKTFWLFSVCPYEFSISIRIIIALGWPNRSCQNMKFFGSENFWFITTCDSTVLIVVWYNPDERAGRFSKICSCHWITEVMRRYSTLDLFMVSMWYTLRRISLILSKFLLDLLKYNALLIYIFVSHGNMMLILPETSIKFAVPAIIFTLAYSKVKLVK